MKMLLFTILCPSILFSQLNCNAFEDSNCKKACEIVNYAEPYQGLRESQELFDRAIELCPNMDYAYREKAVPYLKRGFFTEWKEFIDMAVEMNPKENLGYRGWCQYQFLRNYLAAIKDIENFEKLVGEDNIGFSQNGNYSLQIVKALCYKGIGENGKAIEIIEKQLSKKDYVPLMFDYYHLAVLYFEQKNYVKAQENFEKQIKMNDYYAEPYYYLAQVFNKENNKIKAGEMINIASDYYTKSKFMKDNYTTVMDKVYEKEIKNLKKSLDK